MCRTTPTLSFRFKTFNVPGALESSAFGINNAGVVVGYYTDASRLKHGYIAQSGTLTSLDDPNGTDTLCNDVNDLAAFSVVGQYTTTTGAPMGFLYENGRFSNIPGPSGATGSSAVSINRSGDIVGFYLDASRLAHGFLFRQGSYTTLDAPGGIITVGTSINDEGTVLLYGSGQLAIHGYLEQGVAFQAFVSFFEAKPRTVARRITSIAFSPL